MSVPPRVVVERVQPEIDGGRFPIKRVTGDIVGIRVHVFADGHDQLAGVLRHRPVPPPAGPLPLPGAGGPAPGPVRAAPPWTEVPLEPLGNDEWRAAFTVEALGGHEYTVEAWVDRFASWRHALAAKAAAGQDVESELLEGAALVDEAAGRAGERAAARLAALAARLRGREPSADRIAAALAPDAAAMMAAHPDRRAASAYPRVLRITVDPPVAACGAWYEMFPRSCTDDPSRGGTFRSAEARLPDIAAMGFDVLYLPPIHPIGRRFRKGRNNTLEATPTDPGSPWAIGAAEGGHTAVHPELGTLADFDRFVAAAGKAGLSVALDIAFQASADHPWLTEHPEWFRRRPDGTIKYAENPPKKYQDIYPIDFESDDWQGLWAALRDVFLFWADHGVTIFRVDNPHTKAFAFWEWVIAEIKRQRPDAVFLSEAFTRPKVMAYLAKIGFSQSYTYFTWRNSAHELREYLTELTQTELREYLRPNFFANTPDILHVYLQTGGRPAFEARLLLAATLAANYGIYSGFELCENVPLRAGSEEYINSEKYEIRRRDWDQPGSLAPLIARVNGLRRAHAALRRNATLAFLGCDNAQILWYAKTAPGDAVLVAVNTDPHHVQHGWVQAPLDALGLPPDASYQVEDGLDGTRYTWRGDWNYVRLDPAERAGHVFTLA